MAQKTHLPNPTSKALKPYGRTKRNNSTDNRNPSPKKPTTETLKSQVIGNVGIRPRAETHLLKTPQQEAKNLFKKKKKEYRKNSGQCGSENREEGKVYRRRNTRRGLWQAWRDAREGLEDGSGGTMEGEWPIVAHHAGSGAAATSMAAWVDFARRSDGEANPWLASFQGHCFRGSWNSHKCWNLAGASSAFLLRVPSILHSRRRSFFPHAPNSILTLIAFTFFSSQSNFHVLHSCNYWALVFKVHCIQSGSLPIPLWFDLKFSN